VVPEPSPLALLSAGLLGFAVMVRRHRERSGTVKLSACRLRLILHPRSTCRTLGKLRRIVCV
jgi:hypothetical protein